jgi:S1-C subfamily serine protease
MFKLRKPHRNIEFPFLLVFTLGTFFVSTPGLSKIGFRKCQVGVIVKDSTTAAGTAFVAENGHTIITAAHVITGPSTYYFAPMGDRKKYSLKLIKIYRESDIAILKTEVEVCASGLKVSKTIPSVGDTIGYIGYSIKTSTKTTADMIMEQSILYSVGKTQSQVGIVDFIEFQGKGQPGFSGGPIFNQQNEVIGIMETATYWSIGNLKSLMNRGYLFSSITDDLTSYLQR